MRLVEQQKINKIYGSSKSAVLGDKK